MSPKVTFTKAVDRFYRKIQKKENGCLEWIGTVIPETGYGHFSMGADSIFLAHRFAYQIAYGDIPAGMTLDHTCHHKDSKCPGGTKCLHRRCVNPDHLEIVTQQENVRRSLWKQKCLRGHELIGENVILRKNGSRQCRECGRLHAREYQRRVRAQLQS